MNILFLTRLYFPHIGGVERHVEEIGKRLIVKGKGVTVVTTKYAKELKLTEKKDGVEIIRFRQPRIKYLGLLYTWLWMLKNIDLIKESDIVHVHDVFIWYLPFRFLFPKKAVYITFHGRWGKYPIPFSDIIQKRLGVKLSNKVISVGEYIPKNYGFKSDITLYGGVDIPSGNIDKKENLIIYVGRLDEDTGLTVFLDAVRCIRSLDYGVKLKVEFLGDGKLRGGCERYGRVHGFTDPAPFYKKAKFCFASGYLTIHEALVNKCLVFTAYMHSLQKDYYVLTPFSKFITISDNPQKLAERLIYLSKNKKTAQKLIVTGYNWVKSETWEKLTDQYLELWGVK